MADEKRTVLLEIVVDSKGAIKGVKDYTKAVDDATTATEEQTTATKKQDEAQEESNKETKKATKETKDYTGALDSLNDSLGVIPGELSGAIKGVTGLTKGFKGLKLAIAATGIGALIIAIAAVFTWFNRTREGTEKLNKIMGFLGAAFDVVLDVVGDVGEALFNAISNPLELFEKFKKGVSEFLSDPLGFAKDAAVAVGNAVAGIAKEINEESKAGAALADRTNKLQRQRLAFITREQELTDQIAASKLTQERGDISAAQRLQANLKAQELTRQLATESIKLQREAIAIEEEAQALGDSNIEDEERLAFLKRDLIALTTTQSNEIAGLLGQQKALTAETKTEREESDKILENARLRAEATDIIVRSQAETEIEIESLKQEELKGIRTEGTKVAIDLAEEELTAKEAFNELEAKNKAQLILGGAKLALGAFEALFGANKATAVANALIDTALGIVNALSFPLPLIVPGIALAATVGGAQVAAILATPPPPKPTFARGGMLTGRLHSQGGIDVNAEHGEAVINRRSMSDPYLRGLASAINQAGGGVPFMAEGGMIGISEAQNIIGKSLGQNQQVPQAVLVTEDLNAVQNRVSVTEDFSTL